MTTQQWAVEFAGSIVEFLKSHDIKGLSDSVKEVLAEHIDDEIPGYCDGCEFTGDSDRAREPSAAEEARMMGEDRG